MKKRVLFYLVALVSTVSLQSCATNYVVSKPATYTKEYKTDAKLASIDSKKMEQDKQKLIDSFLAEKAASIANAKKQLRILRLPRQSNTIKPLTVSLLKLKHTLELLTDTEELQEEVLIVQLLFFLYSGQQQALAYQE